MQSPLASPRPRQVAMRRAWTVCFVMVPVLILPFLLLAPEWPLYHLWFFGIIVISLLLWLRSLWWVGDWIHELAGQRWPHRFPQGTDRGFFEPKRFSFLQWMAIAMQAPLLILGAAMGYGLSFECIPLIAIPAGLAGGAVFALIATWLVARIYNTWRYGSNLPIGNLIAYFVTAVILRVFSH